MAIHRADQSFPKNESITSIIILFLTTTHMKHLSHTIKNRSHALAWMFSSLVAFSIVNADPAAPAAPATPAKETSAKKAEEIEFRLSGKVREKDGVHEFFIPHPEKFSVLILPGDPAKLCAETSTEGAARMKELEGLEMGRCCIAGLCVPRSDDKPGHVITKITEMMPLGEGVVRTDTIDLQGTLEVRGDPNAENFLTKSDIIFHGPDGVDFRIPAKKFAGKPNGLTYQDAAKLDKQTIHFKAKAQFFKKSPHRIATILDITPVKK